MLKPSEYLLTPKDVWVWLRGTDLQDVVTFAALAVFTIALPQVSAVSFQDAVFLAFLMGVFYWNSDSRWPIGLALACLALIPVFVGATNYTTLPITETWSEALAVWAFYFLCIGVLKQIADVLTGQTEGE